jgi:hypothetical protein
VKQVRTKYLAVLLCGLMIGLVLSRIGPHRSAPVGGGNWLAVSTPVSGNRTNSTGATPTVSFRVSNVGRRAVDLQVGWFECRTKRDRTRLATNQLASVNIPLPPGTSTNLIIDICPTTAPVEEWLCCCQVRWVERTTGFRRAANMLNNWIQLRLNIALFEPKALNSGLIYAGNVDVAEYFRLMYGLPRAQSKDTLVQPQSTPPESTAPMHQVHYTQPTADEEAEDAFLVFSSFCQSSTNSPRNAEPGTSPNAAPPQGVMQRGLPYAIGP